MKLIRLGKFSFEKVWGMLIEVTYLTIFFAIPLIMAFFLPTSNVFELNKIVLFRSLIYVLFSLTLIKALFWPSSKKFSLKYLWPVGAFLILGAITLIFSVDPANSYYGLNDRQQGYRSLLFYAWWFFLLFYNLVTSDNLVIRIQRILWVIIGSSALVSLYAILQILGIDFISWTEPPFLTHRAFSTLGQPNFLGSYLVLVIPLTIWGLVRFRQFWLRFFLSLVLLAQLAALVATGSRSAWLGLAVALGLLFFWNLTKFWPGLSRPKKRGLILISILTLALMALLISQNDYLSERFRSSFNFSQGSVSARFNFWSGALESIIQRPLLGYGLENQGGEFIKYYKVDWAQVGFVNASTNRAHNLFLDILLTVGIIGLGFYLWVYGAFFKWTNDNRREKKDRLWSEFLLIAVLAYLVSLLFGFSIVVTEIYFWAYFAISAALRAQSSETVSGNFRLKLVWPFKMVIIGLALLFSGYQIYGEFKLLVADNYFLEMRQALVQNDHSRSLFYYQKIKEQNVYDFYYDASWVDSLPLDLEVSFSPVIANLFRKELNDILLSPSIDDHSHYYLRAKIYSLLADYSKAGEAYQKIIALSPELPKNYVARAKYYQLFGADDLALADLNKALELLPAPVNYPESRSWSEKSVANYRSLILRELGDIYFRQQKYDLAGVNFRASYLLNLNDLATYKKIADTYFMRGDLETAIWYHLRAHERHSNDYVWPFSLAVLYGERGDYSSSAKYLATSLALDLDNNISPTMINSIKK